MKASADEGATETPNDETSAVGEAASAAGGSDIDQRLEALVEHEDWTLLEEQGYGYGV